MFKIGEVRAAELLNMELEQDFLLFGVSDPEMPEEHSIIFVKSELNEAYTQVKNSIFITREDRELEVDASSIHLKSKMPKNLYGELLEKFQSFLPEVAKEEKGGSYISLDLKLGECVKIAPFCVIGQDVVIGDNCEIGAGTIIKDHVRIGNGVQIKEHCVIGAEDADIYHTEDGRCRTLPHLAGTVIEDGCLLLAGAVLAAGDTKTTVLGKGSMIGMLGDVGHNCKIGEHTLISGKSSISGHCVVGNQVYVAPMAVTTNRIVVEEGAYLGLGAVAIKDVPKEEKQFGNPARKVLEMKKK